MERTNARSPSTVLPFNYMSYKIPMLTKHCKNSSQEQALKNDLKNSENRAEESKNDNPDCYHEAMYCILESILVWELGVSKQPEEQDDEERQRFQNIAGYILLYENMAKLSPIAFEVSDELTTLRTKLANPDDRLEAKERTLVSNIKGAALD